MDFEDDFEKEQEEYERDLLRELREVMDFDDTALPGASRAQGGEEIAKVEAFIDHIRQTDIPGIDKEVLATAIDLVYRSGLHQNEIPKLTIDDLKRNGLGNIYKISISGPQGDINVDPEVSELLEEYVEYLESHAKHQTTPESNLFPGYNNIRKVKRDFDAYNDSFKLSINDFHEIRKAGIEKHYHSLRNQKMNESDILIATGEQFRISPEEVYDSIHGNIKGTGKKKITGKNKDDEEIIQYWGNIQKAKSIEEARGEHDKFSECIDRSSYYNREDQVEEKVKFKKLFEKILNENISRLKKEASEPPTEQDKTKDQRTLAEIVGLPKRPLLKDRKE